MTSIQEAASGWLRARGTVPASSNVHSEDTLQAMDTWVPPVIGALAAAVVITLGYVIYRFRNHIRYGCDYKQPGPDDDEIDIVDLYVSKSPQATISYPNSHEFVIPVMPYCPQNYAYPMMEHLGSPPSSGGVGPDQEEGGSVSRRAGRRTRKMRMSTIARKSQLDVTLYEDGSAGEFSGVSTIHARGRLHLAVLHDGTNLCVIVNILEAAHVTFEDGHDTPGPPDTCLKVKLIQKSRQSSDQLQCSRVFSSATPQLKYDASFCFFVTDKLKPKKTYVVASVNSVDKFSRMTEIGQVCLQVSHVESLVGAGRVLDTWRDLIPASVVMRCYGDLLVSLCHRAADSVLTASVIEARKLVHADDGTDSDEGELYVSVAMLSKDQILRRRRSSSHNVSVRPEFNEEYNFDVASDSLSSVTLVFTVFSRDSNGKSTMLGKMNVGSMAYAFGTGLDHWTAMIANCDTPVKRWHTLM